MGKGTVDITTVIEIAETASHQISDDELLPEEADILEMLKSFKSACHIEEGKLSREMTPKGKTVRQHVKFLPCESLISEVMGQLSAKLDLDLKDLLK